ncbi:ABC transporter substrate-binding protein [Paenibacillus glycinis]|uniref:Extracellular solute-binding protein n=1 Tax=Paenibacillus glycinis TaxID=2697035 RepID=A0ABW9XK38_9BACL|nr:ABC transporter substrate-binding protein [Paenibacillus glycinis]NBD22972.1 extracellular solute-binding protein [Paenibacillus glycinis]
MLFNKRFRTVFGMVTVMLALSVVLAACGASNTNSNNSGTANAGGASTSDTSPTPTDTADAPSDKPAGIDIELGKDGPVKIDFWHIQATEYGEAVKDIVAQFNKAYEGKIVVNEVFQGSYTELNQKLRAALQGGGLPAVAMANESDILQYMKADQIVQLDDYINDPTYGLKPEEVSDILPAILDRQRAIYDGKTMSWPHGNSSTGIYYNKDVLKKAGYDAPAKTWKEFEQQALDIYKKTGVPALVIGNGTGYGSHAFNFMTELSSYGIDPIAPDLSGVNFDNPQAAELLGIYKNLLDQKAIVVAEDTEQEFTNGRAAMEIGTTARTTSKLNLIKDKFQWGITLFPQGDAGKPTTNIGGGNQVLFKTTPEQQLAGWLFLKYFAGKEGQAIYGAKTGYFPATLSSQDVDVLKQDYAANPQKAQAFKEVFPFGKAPVATAASNVIQDAVNTAIMNVYSNKASVADALKSLQAEAAKLLAENK